MARLPWSPAQSPGKDSATWLFGELDQHLIQHGAASDQAPPPAASPLIHVIVKWFSFRAPFHVTFTLNSHQHAVSLIPVISLQKSVAPMLVQCWPSVLDQDRRRWYHIISTVDQHLMFAACIVADQQRIPQICPFQKPNSFAIIMYVKLWCNHAADPSVNTKRWPDCGLMLGQRRRRWPNFNPASGQRVLITGRYLWVQPGL